MTSPAEIPAFEIAPGYDGFAVLPAPGGTVGLLILPEMFGVTPAMQGAAQDFARAGIPALVLNTFWRSRDRGALTYDGPDRERAQSRADALDWSAVGDDVERAVTAFKSRVPSLRSVAALGHCIGGGLAVAVLAQTSLAAAISYYGFEISGLGETLARLDKPAQLHYGLADPYIPAREIEAVKALRGDNPRVAVFEYPGAGHSFCNPYRPMYDEGHARRAHERALSLLRSLAS